MAIPEIPHRAKLFIGILYSSEISLKRAEKRLLKKFGPVDHKSSPSDFDHTKYYDDMGTSLKKIFYSFEKLILPEKLPDIKLYTNSLEKFISGDSGRIINIDPGYLTLSNVFLASCKNFYHRGYAGKGVYLENEYWYSKKAFNFWEWTYPDYKKKEYLDFFYAIRKIYQRQLKSEETL